MDLEPKPCFVCGNEFPRHTKADSRETDPLVWCANKKCVMHDNSLPLSVWDSIARGVDPGWRPIKDSRCPPNGTDLLVCWWDGKCWQYRACEVWHAPDWSLTGGDTKAAQYFMVQRPPKVAPPSAQAEPEPF